MMASATRRRSLAATWIKELIARGLTVTAISERADVHYNTVRLIRDNPVGNIDDQVFDKLRKLAEQERVAVDETEAKPVPDAPGPSYGLGIKITDDSPPRAEVSVPSTAREFYENFEFHGGKVDWLELEEEVRSFYENLHSFLIHAIDSANEKYAASLREIRAARDRDIRAALEEFEKTFRKRMLGILGN